MIFVIRELPDGAFDWIAKNVTGYTTCKSFRDYKTKRGAHYAVHNFCANIGYAAFHGKRIIIEYEKCSETIKKLYRVVVESHGPRKIAVIVRIRRETNFGLKEAKEASENTFKLPETDKETANKLAAALREEGATVKIK